MLGTGGGKIQIRVSPYSALKSLLGERHAAIMDIWKKGENDCMWWRK